MLDLFRQQVVQERLKFGQFQQFAGRVADIGLRQAVCACTAAVGVAAVIALLPLQIPLTVSGVAVQPCSSPEIRIGTPSRILPLVADGQYVVPGMPIFEAKAIGNEQAHFDAQLVYATCTGTITFAPGVQNAMSEGGTVAEITSRTAVDVVMVGFPQQLTPFFPTHPIEATLQYQDKVMEAEIAFDAIELGFKTDAFISSDATNPLKHPQSALLIRLPKGASEISLGGAITVTTHSRKRSIGEWLFF